LWLIETAVFQMPQLHKHFNVVRNFMKNLLFIITFLVGQNAFGQYKIDLNVQKEFDNLFSKQPKEIQDKRYIKGFDNGFALLLTFKEDTLNIKDFTPIVIDTSITIVSVDENGNELPETPKDTTKFNQWLSCQATYLNDTLGIGTFFGLLSGLSLSVKIIGNKSIGGFYEYSSGDNIYRYKLTSAKSTNIQVDAETKNVILSKLPEKLGDVFYGKATLVTKPFYEDNSYFKNGFIYKRYLVTFLFTCKLIDNEEK
jgi:hypothetical protein